MNFAGHGDTMIGCVRTATIVLRVMAAATNIIVLNVEIVTAVQVTVLPVQPSLADRCVITAFAIWDITARAAADVYSTLVFGAKSVIFVQIALKSVNRVPSVFRKLFAWIVQSPRVITVNRVRAALSR